MAARKLKVVSDETGVGEPGMAGELQSVKSAAASSHRDLLVALRDKIAGDIDAGVPARDLASLSRRLLEITEQIAKIDADDKGDDVGEAADTPDEAWPST